MTSLLIIYALIVYNYPGTNQCVCLVTILRGLYKYWHGSPSMLWHVSTVAQNRQNLTPTAFFLNYSCYLLFGHFAVKKKPKVKTSVLYKYISDIIIFSSIIEKSSVSPGSHHTFCNMLKNGWTVIFVNDVLTDATNSNALQRGDLVLHVHDANNMLDLMTDDVHLNQEMWSGHSGQVEMPVDAGGKLTYSVLQDWY